jgi:hypothetical protein
MEKNLGRMAGIETALARSYGVRKPDLLAFGARLGTMQKLGLLGPDHQPGRGKPLDYTPPLVWRYVCALELLEAGLSPAIVMQIVKRLWDKKIFGIFIRAAKAAQGKPGPKDVLLLLGLSVLRDSRTGGVPLVKESRRSTLARDLEDWNLDRAITALRLSERLRKFEESYNVLIVPGNHDISGKEVLRSRENRDQGSGTVEATGARHSMRRRTRGR